MNKKKIIKLMRTNNLRRKLNYQIFANLIAEATNKA
jgi:hypothetical protein